VWPLERAAAVLYAWREWTRTVPDEMTSVGRLLRVPPLPDIPEPFRGRSFVVVEGVYLGAEDDAAKLLAPLRALAPEMDTFATMPVQDLHHLHMDPEQPVPGAADGMLLEDFPPEAVDSLLEVAGAAASSPLISVEIRHLEGALADPKPTHGALASIEAAFAVFAVGIAPSPEAKAAVHSHIEFLRGALAPWSEGREYLNFTERPTDGRPFYREQAYRRLRRIKAHYDPVEIIRSNHPIPPAS
jgi:hypothetical protein